MLAPLTAGVALFLAWGVLWLLHSRWMALPAYNRPRLTHSPAYALWSGPLRKTILVTALLLLAAAHPLAAAAAVVALVGGWATRRITGGAGGQRRALERELLRLKREQPEAAEVELLYRAIYARHRRWGPDLVKQIVQENPTLDEAARMVWRLERELTR